MPSTPHFPGIRLFDQGGGSDNLPARSLARCRCRHRAEHGLLERDRFDSPEQSQWAAARSELSPRSPETGRLPAPPSLRKLAGRRHLRTTPRQVRAESNRMGWEDRSWRCSTTCSRQQPNTAHTNLAEKVRTLCVSGSHNDKFGK